MSETLIQLPRDEGTKGQRDKGNAPLVPLSLGPSVPSSPSAPSSHRFIGYAKLIGAITFLSRLLGMARESIAANYFGSSAIYSAFALAFTIPNLFRKLLGEGALSAAFIPLYAVAARPASPSSSAGRGDAGVAATEMAANDFACASVNLLCTILLALTIVGEILLFALVLLVPMPADYLLAAKLTMIMLPYVLLVCGAAFLGSILQVHERFAAITFTAVVSNVCLIVAMIAAARRFDLHSEYGQTMAVYWLSISVLIAGAVQVAILLPSLRAIGFVFRPMLHFWTPAVQRMIKMTIPVALSAGVLQISVLMDRGIAFCLSQGSGREYFHLFGHAIRLPMAEGATQRLSWAQFLYQFPLGVFAIALATAIFPKLAADAHDEDRTKFRSVLRHGIEASLFIGLPASVGMIIVRYPAVRLLFQRGMFTADDTQRVALSTALYSAAIWAFSLQQILNRAYYALHDTVTPLVWGIVNLSINLIVELPLLWTNLGESAMAAGTLVSFAIQSVIMLWMLGKREGGMDMRASVGPIVKMIIASALMWIACVGIQRTSIYPQGSGTILWGLQLLILMVVGGIAYFGTCAAMGINVLEHIRPRARKHTGLAL